MHNRKTWRRVPPADATSVGQSKSHRGHRRPLCAIPAVIANSEPQPIGLEELFVATRAGIVGADASRETNIGVMMIPVPQAAFSKASAASNKRRKRRALRKSRSPRAAHDYLAANGRGRSYLGFIFARGENPETVEMRCVSSRQPAISNHAAPCVHSSSSTK